MMNCRTNNGDIFRSTNDSPMSSSCRRSVGSPPQFLTRTSLSSPMVMVQFGKLPYGQDSVAVPDFHNERSSLTSSSDSQLPATRALESLSRPKVSTMLRRRLWKSLSLSPSRSSTPPSMRRLDIDNVIRESRRSLSDVDFPTIEWSDDEDVDMTKACARLKKRESKSRLVRSKNFKSKLHMLKDDEIACDDGSCSSSCSTSSMDTESNF